MRRAGRIIRRALLCVVFGAALNVSVAWSCIAWSSPVQAGRKYTRIAPEHPVAASISRYGSFDTFLLWSYAGPGWRHDYVMAGRKGYSASSQYQQNDLELLSAGWPWLCFNGERRTIAGQTATWRLIKLPALPGANFGRLSSIPCSPRWAALLANTGAFGIGIAGLMAGTSLAMRLQRIGRGRCSHCGYLLTGLPVANGVRQCPECGVAAKRSK